MSKKLKHLSLNMWGLPFPWSRNLKGRVKQIIDFIKKEDYDVVCLQECWFKSHVNKIKKELNNYYVSSSEKGLIKNESGLLILTKEKPISTEFFPFLRPFILSRMDEFFAGKGVLATSIKIEGKEIIVMNTHIISRSNPSHDKFSKEQLRALSNVVKKFPSCIVAGDLNINAAEFLKWKKINYNYCLPNSPSLNPKNPYRKFSPLHFNKDGDTISHVFVKTNPIKTKIKTKILDDIFISDHQPTVSEIVLN